MAEYRTISLFGGVMIVGRMTEGNRKSKYLCTTWGRSEPETMRFKFVRNRHGGYVDILQGVHMKYSTKFYISTILTHLTL